MRRWHAEVVVGALFAVMTVVTAIEPQWIEVLFGAEPDGGSGAVEWVLVAVLGAVAIVLTVRGLRHRGALSPRGQVY